MAPRLISPRRFRISDFGFRIQSAVSFIKDWRIQSATRNPQSAIQSGFTFIELIIATTMLAVLFIGLGAHLRGGITVWRQVTSMGDRLQRQRLALERLERDWADAIVYDDRTTSYGDEEGKLPWPQLGESSMAWFTASPATRQSPVRARVVSYRCTEHDGIQGLWRTSQSIGEARARRQPPVPELILPGCQQLVIEYAVFPKEPTQPLEWQTQWDDPEKALPRLLKVMIDQGNGSSITRWFENPIGSGRMASPPPS